MPVDRPGFEDLVCFNFYVGWRRIQALYRQAFPDGVSPQRAYLLCACDPTEDTPVRRCWTPCRWTRRRCRGCWLACKPKG
jgi:hypothetical protein